MDVGYCTTPGLNHTNFSGYLFLNDEVGGQGYNYRKQGIELINQLKNHCRQPVS